jgi:hypothetical protein
MCRRFPPSLAFAAHEVGRCCGGVSFPTWLNRRLTCRCDLDPDRVAVWWSEKLALRLSALAAQVLVNAKLINMKSLEPHSTLHQLHHGEECLRSVSRHVNLLRTEGISDSTHDRGPNECRCGSYGPAEYGHGVVGAAIHGMCV